MVFLYHKKIAACIFPRQVCFSRLSAYLIHWGRHIGILKCHTSLRSTGLSVTAEFEALILLIYDKMESKPTTVAYDYAQWLYSTVLTNLLISRVGENAWPNVRRILPIRF